MRSARPSITEVRITKPRGSWRSLAVARSRRFLLLLAAACLAAGVTGAQSAPGEAPSRLRLARIELRGPLEEVHLALQPPGRAAPARGGDASPGNSFGESIGATLGDTRFSPDLGAGERRSLLVPVPAWGDVERLAPRIETRGGGSATFEGWAPENAVADAGWAALPRGLRRRPRAAPPVRITRHAPVPVIVAAAVLALGWSLRRKTWACVAVCVAGAGFTFAISATPGPSPALRVLEGDGAAQAWMLVDAERGRLTLGTPWATPGRWWRLESRPERARLHVVGEPSPLGDAWRVEAGRAELLLLTEWSASTGDLDAGANRLGDLDAAWLRAADGSGWRALGPWAKGAPVPPGPPVSAGTPGPQDPPGALNPALPLGVEVLLGRLAVGTTAPSELRRGPAFGETWVRLVAP